MTKLHLDVVHAETLLAMAHSFRKIVRECESDLTTEQAEALEELKYECASARKAALRQTRRN